MCHRIKVLAVHTEPCWAILSSSWRSGWIMLWAMLPLCIVDYWLLSVMKWYPPSLLLDRENRLYKNLMAWNMRLSQIRVTKCKHIHSSLYTKVVDCQVLRGISTFVVSTTLALSSSIGVNDQSLPLGDTTFPWRFIVRNKVHNWLHASPWKSVCNENESKRKENNTSLKLFLMEGRSL